MSNQLPTQQSADDLRRQFTEEVEDIVHDLRAPLSSLLMIVKHANEVPDKVRANIQEVIVCIEDVANNMLNNYRGNHAATSKRGTVAKDSSKAPYDLQAVLLSTVLLEMLTEKKYQYQDLPIKLESKITPSGYFTFVQFDLALLRGLLFDVLDRAIHVNEGNKNALITVKLDNDGKLAKIVIEDNGHGISADIISKIMNHIEMNDREVAQCAVLLQVRDLMLKHQCRFTIKSQEDKGTKITLILPVAPAPNWIVDCIELRRGDTIVILDDEPFIHKAWATRFNVEVPYIKIKHFEVALEAINFINALSTEEKQKICLLVDYELARNEPSGVQVIKQLQLGHSILVTNHYDSTAVRVEALDANSRILPKQLALEVPLKIAVPPSKSAASTDVERTGEINLVVVDDDPLFVKNLCKFVFHDRVPESYNDPQEFLDNVLKYPKDITILLDYDFGEGKLSGLDLSKELHKMGFTGFRILSGHAFEQREIPNYVDAFVKTDLDTIKDF